MNNYSTKPKEKTTKEHQTNSTENLIDCIKVLLGIKDTNITILGETVEKTIKGIKTKVISAKLTYTTQYCERCKCKDKDIVKNGLRKTTVKMGRTLDGLPLLLELKKQRYMCKNCNETFVAKTSLVKKHSNISNIVKRNIAIELSKIQSMTSIAEKLAVSIPTVLRILKELNDTTKIIKALPSHLSFDELKTTNDVKGAMSFIYSDAQKHEIIDMVMDRKLPSLKQYFIRIPRKERLKVKTITIDMYTPYVSLIQELFPKTKIIIDKFHIIQHINREFNKLRIKIMNEIKNSNKKLYTKYKKYWKLLLKDVDELTDDIIYTRKETLIQRELVMNLIKQDTRLEKAYWIMQDIRTSLKQGDYDMFMNTITTKDALPKGIRKALNTFNKYRKQIRNTMMYPQYTNGHLEGINNKLKLIKRVAFGYRKYENFKARALIIFRVLKQPKVTIDNKTNRIENKIA